MVILEACQGAYLANQPVHASVAPPLLQAGIGSVVAFSHSVHIKAARILVEHFYTELAQGASVGKAVDKARDALYKYPKRFLARGPDAETIDLMDWFIPQLYQAGDDPVLLTAPSVGWAKAQGAVPLTGEEMGMTPSADASDTFAHPTLEEFPPSPQYLFQGRAPELLQLERAFRKHPAVLLHAMGGMGKTALAREAAHWWLRKGTIRYTVFHSFERLAGAERVVQVLGQALMGDRFSALPADEQWRRAVRLFHENPVLLVWDNFETTLPRFADALMDATSYENHKADDPITGFSSESRELLQRLYRDFTAPKNGQSPRGKLLITCRQADAGLPGVEKLELKGLACPDALYLLRAVIQKKAIDPERPGYERHEIDNLLKMLAWQPLAIELVTPHLAELTPEQIRAEFPQHLECFTDDSHPEARNRSLLASLDFSVQRLSPNARKVLPLLSWFRGGVFETFLLAFTERESAEWAAVRKELVATALIRVEEAPDINDTYLEFHPILPFIQSGDVAMENAPALRDRFLAMYLDVRDSINDALLGKHPAAGMQLAMREEGNLRRALTLALKTGKRWEGWQVANILLSYLERTGRLRERDKLVNWIKKKLPQSEMAGDINYAWDAHLNHAWSLFTQGHAQEALDAVQKLREKLEQNGGSPFQIAKTQLYLGRIHLHTGRSDLALVPLQAAITDLERLGTTQQANLAASLGSLGNAYQNLSQFDEALAAAERALGILRGLGQEHGIATGLGQTACILMDTQHYPEAEQRYHEALAAARRVEDRELEGAFLHNLGILYREQGRYTDAVKHCRDVIRTFQEIGNKIREMQICDLFATAERGQGRLDEAMAWYERCRELAVELKDRRQLAVVAHNLGSFYQYCAEQKADPAMRAAWLEKGLASVRESLKIKREMQDKPGAAMSYAQLSILYRMSGNLDAAEENARQSLAILEPLNHPHLLYVYDSLMQIAHARGDEKAAVKWQKKRDAKLAELEKLRSGPGN
uniref:Tetratricopeptide repeat-containing protein n=1 Tax=Candidatus Kentrum sp. MB TaxID=2138164 RepID=A0A451B9J6_9GAMM|nr:MAG: Tetratricopeptide repeat-containing protein [Candidatus Kentron sp. MB]VFK74945.1 MAG: Tetratricopeptide repeat-containing protein [Candidatus Kentron sp. MB]